MTSAKLTTALIALCACLAPLHAVVLPLPTTKWNATRGELTVSWQDQTDVIRSTTNQDGRTRLEIRRNGGEPLRMP